MPSSLDTVFSIWSILLVFNFFHSRATNPSQFEIDFFVNDLSKRGAATFEQVGQFQYKQKGPINLEFDKKVIN